MKIGDKVTSKKNPEFGIMTVMYIDPSDTQCRIVTVSIPEGTHAHWNSGGMDDGDYDDLVVVDQCRNCIGRNAETHITEDHDEYYVAKLAKCDECGAESGKDCKPSCRWAYCTECGKQQDDCNYGRNHNG